LEKKFPDTIAKIDEAWPGEAPIRLMFMDEARFGRIPTRDIAGVRNLFVPYVIQW
jgi:hypothetical protein